jgi:D-alanine-D-alanine ligase
MEMISDVLPEVIPDLVREPIPFSRVVIAHNPVGAEADASTSDVLAQVALVAAGLESLGIPVEIVPMPDWQPWRCLRPAPGMAVFNLMEAPAGRPEALLGAAAVLELLGMPFTGSPSGVLWVTTDKLATRAVLAAEGLPVAPGGRLDPDRPGGLLARTPGPWILKPACEDASLGLEGDPLCATPEAAIARARELAARFPGQAVVTETFLPGRELNVSLLAGGEDGVEVLPVAEIVYEGFPDGMSRVLGYDAKWHEESFAYTHTVRHFPEDPADAALLARAGELSRAAWRIFGLRGYARVDLRLDETGEPCILEINANPCLAADGGFMAAATKAGLSAGDVVQRILSDAVFPRTAR